MRTTVITSVLAPFSCPRIDLYHYAKAKDRPKGLWTVRLLDIRLHLGQFTYCTLHLRSPQQHISGYSYGCRINSDNAILAVHCITV